MASIRPPHGRRGTGTPAGPPAAPPAAAACPTRQVVDVLADKWAPLVLCALAPGTRRFQELRRGVTGVTQKMLTQTLRALERDGLVSRRAYATVPPRVEYSLTPLGRSLTGPLWTLRDWAWAHVAEVEAARHAYDATAAATRNAGPAIGA